MVKRNSLKNLRIKRESGNLPPYKKIKIIIIMKTNDFMTKKFGASGIKRNMLADYFFGDEVVIEEASDEVMQRLADSLENHIRKMYPDADEMFAFWSKDIFTDDDVLLVNAKYSESWKKYWDLFGDFAIASGIKVVPRKK